MKNYKKFINESISQVTKSYKEKIKLQSKLDCNFILNMTKPIQDYRRQNT